MKKKIMLKLVAATMMFAGFKVATGLNSSTYAMESKKPESKGANNKSTIDYKAISMSDLKFAFFNRLDHRLMALRYDDPELILYVDEEGIPHDVTENIDNIMDELYVRFSEMLPYDAEKLKDKESDYYELFWYEFYDFKKFVNEMCHILIQNWPNDYYSLAPGFRKKVLSILELFCNKYSGIWDDDTELPALIVNLLNSGELKLKK